MYREDGSILKSLYEETLNVKRDLVCDIDGDNLESSSVGIFPDVFNDAYEIGLIDDLDDDDEDF